MKLIPIAFNTFRESVRDRVLYNLAVAVVLLIVAAAVLGQASLGQEAKIVVDVGLSAMRLFGVVIAVIVGIGLVYKEIDKRTAAVLLSKPIRRWELVVGKFLGLSLTLLVNSTALAAATTLALIWVNGGFDALQWQIWPATWLIWLELTVMTAVALLFSSFSSPALSLLFAALLFVLGNLTGDLKLIADTTDAALTRLVCLSLYYLLPNLSNFTCITETAHGQVVSAGRTLGATAYAALYVTALLAAATLIFERRRL